jgi:acetolactate synthase-1/2/3 large subunit
MGDRHGNFTMQNADLILSFGSRLDFSITGYDRTAWAENAVKIIVDIDPSEVAKLETASNIVPIIADVGDIVEGLLKQYDELTLPDISAWKTRIAEWKVKYPITAPSDLIHDLTTYALVQTLAAQLPEGAYIAPCSAGTTAEIFFQAFVTKKHQKIRSSHGLGSMGFEIPNAIGMCVASGDKCVVCIAGDGGMQLNIQELAIITGRKLPIKLFVINNGGYASIRNMQNNHFKKHYVGCDSSSGLFLPDLEKLSTAYGIEYKRIDNLDEIEDSVRAVISTSAAVICEVVVKDDCLVDPRTVTQVMPDGSMRSSRLENQYPFLPEDEVKRNLLT